VWGHENSHADDGRQSADDSGHRPADRYARRRGDGRECILGGASSASSADGGGSVGGIGGEPERIERCGETGRTTPHHAD
jgi:hypothetical protein